MATVQPALVHPDFDPEFRDATDAIHDRWIRTGWALAFGACATGQGLLYLLSFRPLFMAFPDSSLPENLGIASLVVFAAGLGLLYHISSARDSLPDELLQEFDAADPISTEILAYLYTRQFVRPADLEAALGITHRSLESRLQCLRSLKIIDKTWVRIYLGPDYYLSDYGLEYALAVLERSNHPVLEQLAAEPDWRPSRSIEDWDHGHTFSWRCSGCRAYLLSPEPTFTSILDHWTAHDCGTSLDARRIERSSAYKNLKLDEPEWIDSRLLDLRRGATWKESGQCLGP